MRTIIFGFSTPKEFKLASFSIRLFENSEFSHVYIRMKTKPTSPLPFDKVFQASHGDVNAIVFETFEEKNHIFHEFELEVSDEKYFEVYSWLWHQLGKPYGFKQLLAIAFNVSVGKNGDNKFICSELAAMVLRDFLNVDITKSMDYVGLNDIKEILLDLKERGK